MTVDSEELLLNSKEVATILDCSPDTVNELDRQLGLNESVLRTKVLRHAK